MDYAVFVPVFVEERGQSLVEYALIIALVAIVVIAAVAAFGAGVAALLGPVAAAL